MKKVLITGASSGIGLALAKKMREEGAEITGLARNFAQVPEGLMQRLSIDLAKLDELPQRLADTALLHDDFDCLVLNAGYGRFGGLEQFSHAQIRHLIDTNLVSNLFLLKHFLPDFKRVGGKDIVLLGSESALQGARQGSLYCASKFAIRGLAQSLRAECAKADVRVILINPGAVDTDFFKDLHFAPEAGEDYVLDSDVIAETILHALAQPRNAVIEEINIQPLKRAFKKT
ncbi:MAG: SDR family oxidoreductase [Pseudomonadota bacterium]